MGRPSDVLTKQIVSNIIICVPENEVSEYRKYNKGILIEGHPGSVLGLSAKRQWICDNYGDVFMLDDDIISFNRVYFEKGEKAVINKVDSYEIIQAAYNSAKSAGVYLFGFSSNPGPINFNPLRPIEVVGYITGCAMGVISGSLLKFNSECVAVEDYYISLMNAYLYRKIWKDTRFSFGQKKTMANVGGLANYRTLETEKRDTLFLRKKFGEAIVLKKEITGGANKHNKLNEFARSMRLPF